MSFLFPLLWLGALAILIPLWLHLQRRPDRNVVHFSAVRFLEDQPEPRKSPIIPRNILLLLVRLLAVLFLVAAFTWPYHEPKMVQPVAESRVYILDNTLSRQVNDSFEKDLQALRNEIKNTPSSVQVAVVELTSSPRTVVHFGDSRADADAKLQALRQSWQRGSFLAALRAGAGLLDQALGQKRQIIIYTDSQRNQWEEHANIPPFLKDIDVSLAETRADGEEPSLYVTDVSARRLFSGEKTFASVTFNVGKLGSARAADVVISANGQKIFEKAVQFPAETVHQAVTARWETDPSMWVEGEIAIDGRPDALAGDNRIYFSLPPVRECKVVYVGRSPYMKAALSPEVGKGFWSTRFIEPSQIAAESKNSARADALIVESRYLHARETRDLVLEYLNNGRGVILLLDQSSPVVNRFLDELGFEPLSPERTRAGKDESEGFYYLLADHPILMPFLTPDFGDLSVLAIHEHSRLRSRQAIPLLFSKSGDCLLFDGIKTKGRLLVLPFGMERKQTNWPLHPTFIPFLDLCLQHVRFEGNVRTSIEPGEVWHVELPPDTRARQVVLRDGDSEVARAPVDDKLRAQVRVPSKPGLYALSYDDRSDIEQMIAVNPSPQESALSYVADPPALHSWTLPATEKTASSVTAQTNAAVSLASIFRQRYWWWLILTAAGFLGIEAIYLWLMSLRRKS